MKCPKCQSEAIEKEIPLFADFSGIICRGFDPFSFVSNGANKYRRAMRDKRLYVCTNEKCQYEFEK